MSNTISYCYYISKIGKDYKIGIVESDGVPVTTGDLAIDIWCDKIPNDISSDQDELPIPPAVERGFIMGCVYEILRMFGKEVVTYKQDYEEAITQAIHYQVQHTQQPLVLKMPDLRDDY